MKNVKVLSLVTMASMLIFAPINGSAQKPPHAPEQDAVEMTNKNGNKLFDNLELKLQKSADSDALPVIIQFDSANVNGKAIEALEQHIGEFQTKFEYIVIDGIAATLTKKQIEKLDKLPFIKQVEYDEEVHTFLGSANQWFGTSQARTDFNVTGDRNGSASSYSKDDVVVAIIDTGIDPNHVDLNNGKVIGWKDLVNNRTTAYDDQGHGTHVASITAGEGEANSQYKGVAPDAALVGVKVLDQNGSGSMSTVTAGIDWAVQNKDVYGIEIISLSLGTSGSSDGKDSTSVAVNNAVNAGLVVTVAAGNSGPKTKTIGSPGAAEKAITVGSAADLGEGGFFLSYFSSRGTTADGRIKPDIIAPGHNITAAKAGTTNSYVSYSGTSMATPFTAGTIALMLDANPSLTPTQVQNHLYSTAQDWGPTGKDIDYGNGRLDGYAAVKAAGGFTGTNIAVPSHYYKSGSLPGSTYNDWYDIEVNSTSYPIAVTFIMPNWTSSFFSTSPDYDIYLYNPAGAIVAQAEGTTRQETVTFTPTTTGTYKLKVYSYSGSGNYFFDVSAGASAITQTSNDIK